MNSGLPTQALEHRFGRANLLFALTTVVLIGAAVRLFPLGASAFPLNDGGLFAHMARDLARNGFLLPPFTTYNGEAIPFAYPPLGIYLVTAIAQTLGVDPVAVVRWLPAVISSASIIALYLVGAELLRSRWRGVVAAAAFALMPRSYLWLILGGGITRALGLLFALLALQQGILMLRTHRPAYIGGTAAFGGLTALSHPQAAVFLAVSMLVLVGFHAFRGRGTTVIVQLLLAGLGGFLVAAPWITAVVAAHGTQPLLSAGRTALDPTSGLSVLLGLGFADTSLLDLMTALGVLGIIVRIARGQWMIPVWFMLTLVIDPRAGSTYATVPLALSVVPILGELLQRMIPKQGGAATLESASLPSLVWTHRAASIVIALVLFTTLRTATRITVERGGPLEGLQDGHVAAMRWIANNAAADAQFVVMSGRIWESDYLSEWFPVLAHRVSIATVQGSEWISFDSFLERVAKYHQLQRCATDSATCLSSWMQRWNVSGAYVFVPKGRLSGPSSPADCCPALRETLVSSGAYRVIFESPGATILAPVIGSP